MATQTTNFHFPKYEADDLPNLLDEYNEFADLADAAINNVNQAATNAGVAATNAQSLAQQAQEKASDVEETVDTLNSTVQGVKATAESALSKAEANESEIAGIDSELVTVKADVSTAKSQAASALSQAGTANANASAALAATKPGKLLCIGDSFARMEDSSQTSWCTYLQQKLHASDMTKYAEGGAGFITNGQQGHDFNDLALQAVSGISDKAAYDWVVVAGGINDKGVTSAQQVETECSTLIDNLSSAFPNARIIVVPLLWHNKRDYERKMYWIPQGCNAACAKKGATFVNWAWTWGLGEDNCYDGGIHPLSAGGELIAQYMASAIEGGYSGRQLYIPLTSFGNGVSNAYCSGGSVICDIQGTYNSGQTMQLPNALKCDTMPVQAVVYGDGGGSTKVLQMASVIMLYGDQNSGNIGGAFSFPW